MDAGSTFSGGSISFFPKDTRSPFPVDPGCSLLEYVGSSFLGSTLPDDIGSSFLTDTGSSPPGDAVSTILEHIGSTLPRDPESSFLGVAQSILPTVPGSPFPQIAGSAFPINTDSSFLKDPASSLPVGVESACFKELESIFSKNTGFLFSGDIGAASVEGTGSGFPNKAVSEAPEIKTPCPPTVSGRGLQGEGEQAKFPAGLSEQEAPSPAPLGPLCLESMPRLWSRVCFGGAGMAFGEEQQSLMTGPPVPRLPSCGKQRGLGGLESF